MAKTVKVCSTGLLIFLKYKLIFCWVVVSYIFFLLGSTKVIS